LREGLDPRLEFARLSLPVQLSQERGIVGKRVNNIWMRGASDFSPIFNARTKTGSASLVSAVGVVPRAEVAQYL
jgi:hypothetical protein